MMALLSILLLIASTGCGRTARHSVPPQIAPTNEWLDLHAPKQTSYTAQRANPNPRHILALSGGGSYGAFSAGLLNGWSASGTRPPFDVVTGISAGALAATYAFLGPQHDEELKRLFTTSSDQDLFRRRGPLAPIRSDSYASSAPLRRLIEKQITPEILAEVAEAHAGGRRLYVGTTNLDTGRLVVWDMGAIATRCDRELYINVILASASIPGFFPPVEIPVEVNGRKYVEPHADGGASTQVFVQRGMLSENASATMPAAADVPTTIWVVTAGKIYTDPAPTGTRGLDIAVTGVNGLLHAQTRNDIRRIAELARETKSSFRLTAVPADFPVRRSAKFFDSSVMSRLFNIGYSLGQSGQNAWQSTPPPANDEEAAPRNGTQFLAPERQR